MAAGAGLLPPLVVACCLLLLAVATECLKLELSVGHQECASLYVSERQLQDTGFDGAVVSFRGEVAGPPVSIHLYEPSNGVLWQSRSASDDFGAAIMMTTPGTYRLCFDAHEHHLQPPVVDVAYFLLTHQQATEVHVPRGSEDDRAMKVARREHLNPVREQIAHLTEMAEVLLREQHYLKHRLERHQHTNVSTQRRNLVYTVLEMAALVGVSLLQVLTIRRLFLSQESKSRINV